MHRLLLTTVTLVSAPLLAHPGHGATPAHVHVETGLLGALPVDVGALVLLAVVGVVALVTLAARRRRSP